MIEGRSSSWVTTRQCLGELPTLHVAEYRADATTGHSAPRAGSATLSGCPARGTPVALVRPSVDGSGMHHQLGA